MEAEKLDGKLISDELQVCGFKVGQDQFAVPILEIQEIIRPQIITELPLAPDCIKGLINLRGQIVTAISLRSLFGLEKEHKEDYMNIIVRDNDGLYALIVDEILDVISVFKNDFEPTPDTLTPSIRNFVRGVYKLDSGLLTLLDLGKVLTFQQYKV